MQLLVHVLNQTEKLEELLNKMVERGMGGATVLDSRGMAQILCDENTPMFGMMRSILTQNRSENKTIFTVLNDDQVEPMKALIREVTGGLEKPGTGIMFTVPVNFCEGMAKQQ